MASNISGEMLPGEVERRRILEEAGSVLAEARFLRDCLDRIDGRAGPEKALLTAHMLRLKSPSPAPTYRDRLH